MGCNHSNVMKVINVETGEVERDVVLAASYLPDGNLKCSRCGVIIKENELKGYREKAKTLKLRDTMYKFGRFGF